MNSQTISEDLPEDANNTLKYQIHLSKQPDKEFVEEFKKQLRSIIHDDILIDQMSLIICDKHKNLCIGHIKFDHNIELEWLTVYGLIELSKLNHDLVIKVSDNDGDVILIEAAEHLPSWLETKNSKNRTFIHRGKIHIIPKQINLKELHKNFRNKSVTRTQLAASFIRESETNTLADPAIQNAIKQQLSGFPDKVAWLSKKYRFLDEIVSGKRVGPSDEIIKTNFKGGLTLDLIKSMNEDDLRTSPFSSRSSSCS